MALHDGVRARRVDECDVAEALDGVELLERRRRRSPVATAPRRGAGWRSRSSTGIGPSARSCAPNSALISEDLPALNSPTTTSGKSRRASPATRRRGGGRRPARARASRAARRAALLAAQERLNLGVDDGIESGGHRCLRHSNSMPSAIRCGAPSSAGLPRRRPRGRRPTPQ